MRLWIDAGHGGSDSGATGNGVEEASWNLRLAEAVKAVAQRQGWTVGMSRESDVFIPLADRYKKANAFHADAFVSLHENAGGGEGSEVIYPANHDVGASKALAVDIERAVAAITPSGHDRGQYADRRGLAVLRGTDMPAVIVETAFVDSKSDAAFLKSATFYTTVADAIVRGICTYLGKPFVVVGRPNTPPAPHPLPTPSLHEGDKGAAVIDLQRLLNKHGAKLVVDGDFGAKTKAAVIAFQKAHKLSVGVPFGGQTWGALRA